MLIRTMQDVEAQDMTPAGAQKTTIRVVFGPEQNAPTFALRQVDVQGGGSTPHHTHPYEHEVVVLEGNMKVVGPDGEKSAKAGDAVLIPPDEIHQFKNASETEPAKLLCLIPVEHQK